MKPVVLKFGGSSVATPEKIRNVAKLIIAKKRAGHPTAVVLSAMGKTTNQLIDLANQLSTEPDAREMDLLQSTGEMISISLMSIYLQSQGFQAKSLTGFQAGIRTTGPHMKARIDRVESERLQSLLDEGTIVIIAGFQGIDDAGDITTLGRGGSDTTAVAIAAAIGGTCEIYTDVEGIYTVDPRIRPGAKKLDELSYETTMEMANLGAKVIEPRSVELGQKYDVPIYIALNTGDVPGTYILPKESTMETRSVTNISKVDGVLLVAMDHTDGFADRIAECFLKLAEANVNLDIISHSTDVAGQSVTTFTGNLADRPKIERILNEMGIKSRFQDKVSKVSIIGTAMRNQAGVAAHAFSVFVKLGLRFYEVTTSEISISYVVDEDRAVEIVNALADEFGL